MILAAEQITKRFGTVIYDPRLVVEKMVHAEVLTEELWQEFLDENPNNRDLCFAICRAVGARQRAWEEFLARNPEKEDFYLLFEKSRNTKFLNYYVWEVFKKKKDLTRKDLEKVLAAPKVDLITARQAKRMMIGLPKEEETGEKDLEKGSFPKKNGLAQVENDFVVKKRHDGPRWGKPWERSYRDPI